MYKVFIIMLLALNMVGFNQAMASSNLDHSVIYNDAETPDDENDEEKNPEDECE